MPTTLVETSVFTADVSVPVDADARDAASVQVAFQALANRTKYLHDVLRGNAPLTTLLERQIMVPIESAWATLDGGSLPTWAQTPNGYWQRLTSTGSSAILYFPLRLPKGATLTKAELLVTSAHASAMTAYIQRYGPHDFTTPALTAIANVDSATSAASTGLHLISIEGSPEVALDTSDTTWRIALTGSGAAAGDFAHACRLTIQDPGPRNF